MKRRLNHGAHRVVGALVATAFVTLAGCSTSLPPMRVLGAKAEPEGSGPRFFGMKLRSGQLVISESPDATSFLFPLIPKRFYPFTHIAIISVEDGEPWVYDVTGEVKTFPLKKKLMDNVKGKMYRRRLYEYVAPNLYAEIYDPPEGADGEKMAAFVRQKMKEGVEFDAYFDAHDHSKLFCTELVEMAIAASGGPVLAPEPSNPNPSVVQGMTWLGVPPGEALPPARWAHPSRFVGALGQFASRAAAWGYFEAKREIHRRFTMDQRLGFVVSMDSNGRIDVRPEITAFAMRASMAADKLEPKPEPGDPRLTEVVRKIADEAFGPLPDAGAGAPSPTSSLSLRSRH